MSTPTRISTSFSTWPILQISPDDRFPNVRVIAGPPRGPDEERHFTESLKSADSLFGLCAYQNFPGRILDPNASVAERSFNIWSLARKRIDGWFYCMKDPENYFPEHLARLEYADSDATCFHRITPTTVDGREVDSEKSYDVLYVCRDNEAWNRYCRNWPLAMRCIDRITQAGLSVCVIGCEVTTKLRGHRLVTVMPKLKWYDFLRAIRSARCLLVPNIYDASPRTLAESLCLDVPILVNRFIFGGWHYVTSQTGAFFEDENDVVPGLRKILESKTLNPRDFFAQHFGPENSGKRLETFLEQVLN